MARPDAQIGFPRRVVASYLLFCLVAMVLLAIGAAWSFVATVRSQATGSALSRVGRLTASIQLDRLHNEGTRVEQLLNEAVSDGWFTYVGVVGPAGRFTHHSDTSLVGAVAVEAEGSRLRWGAIDAVRTQDPDGRWVNEYHAPLDAAGSDPGALHLGVVEPSLGAALAGLANYGPLAVAGPLGVIIVGGWWMRRVAGPVAVVDEQLALLARLSHEETPRLKPLPATGIAALGWNRLVEHLDTLNAAAPADPLAERVRLAALAGGGGASTEALESLAEGVAVTDAEGRIDFANRAIAALLGADDSLVGESFHETLARIAPEESNRMAAAGAAAQLVGEATVADGDESRTLRIARSPLRGDPAPGPGGHVWSVRDITQQRLAEKSRDQFIDTATHELRTPLANIKAYAETLAMGDLTDVEEQKEFCNTINSEATRLARFVDDLLSISSIEVGSLGVERQNVDVRRLLTEAADKLRPLMKQRDITFEVSLAEKLGEAKLDKDKVSGLVVNLLGNAAKYTPEGGTVTFAAVRDVDGEADELKIEVRDTGVGIAEDEQAKVFEKFFRSANPDVRDQVGTGLGLSLAREIARLHRGDMTLASELGKGSTFTATLPVA